MIASASDGHGGQSFFDTFNNDKSLDELYAEFMEKDAEHTVDDQWEAQILTRILKKATVIYVSDLNDEMVKNFRMLPVKSLDEAIMLAREIMGNDASILALPDGISIIVKE